eukprot:6472576-Amphidinium_carterae.1
MTIAHGVTCAVPSKANDIERPGVGAVKVGVSITNAITDPAPAMHASLHNLHERGKSKRSLLEEHDDFLSDGIYQYDSLGRPARPTRYGS